MPEVLSDGVECVLDGVGTLVELSSARPCQSDPRSAFGLLAHECRVSLQRDGGILCQCIVDLCGCGGERDRLVQQLQCVQEFEVSAESLFSASSISGAVRLCFELFIAVHG